MLSLRRQYDLLEVDRISLYYKHLAECEKNLFLLRRIDEFLIKHSTLDLLGMKEVWREQWLIYNEKRIHLVIRKMCLDRIYLKRNHSRLELARFIHPYLLRESEIKRPNHVWMIDITYISMRSGFMYLSAIIDVYRRSIVGWQISNCLENETQTELLRVAIGRLGKPEIVNYDQVSHYTCEHWVSTLLEAGFNILLNGKGRPTDNAFIERFFGTLKRKHIYLNTASNSLKLYVGVVKLIKKYNRRKHKGIDRQKPIYLYQQAA